MQRTALGIVLAALFILNIPFGTSGQQPGESPPFFRTIEEDRLHFEKCVARTGGVLVSSSQNPLEFTPNGTFMVERKAEQSDGTIVHGVTEAHVVSANFKEFKRGEANKLELYTRLWVWFWWERFEANVVDIDPALDLALLKVWVPKTTPPWRGHDPYKENTYKSVIDGIIPVRHEPSFVPQRGGLYWNVGYVYGAHPRRIKARFLAHDPDHAPRGIYYFVFEEGPIAPGHSGGYMLDWSCETAAAGPYTSYEGGFAHKALPSNVIKEFVDKGLRKEGIK